MITESPAPRRKTVSANPNLNMITRSAPRRKKVINWRGSQNLYIDHDEIGKRLLRLNEMPEAIECRNAHS